MTKPTDEEAQRISKLSIAFEDALLEVCKNCGLPRDLVVEILEVFPDVYELWSDAHPEPKQP